MSTSILTNRNGSAAVEMALVTPLLLILLCGSVELGNYLMDEHVLIKGVRDGARYAARASFSNFAGCNGTEATVPSALETNTQNIVRKGVLDANASDILPKWTDASATLTISMTCTTSIGSYTPSGVYAGNSVGTANAAPVVVVKAHLPYRSILGSFGFRGLAYYLNATQQAAVTGA